MDSLARIETNCNAGIVKILAKLTDGDLTTTDICQILLPIVRAGGNDVDLKDIQKAVWSGGLLTAMKSVGTILSAALSDGGSEGNVEAAK